MSTRSTFDRESFEKFLASAYAVQKSGLDRQALSALFELNRSIMAGELDLDRALHMVADRARTVANASGVAVAQLVANQLVYRAGSGSAAAYVGRRVPAVLSASAPNQARSEILRVENAEADTRIEAEVCRQFGANALLIVPIYQKQAVAGVLEIFFNEAHTFQPREVLTYRLMAQVVEEAMFPEARPEQKASVIQFPALPRIEPPASPTPSLPAGVTSATPPRKRFESNQLRWQVAAAGLVATLVMIGSITFHHRSALAVDASSVQRSNAEPMQSPAKPMAASQLTSRPQMSASGTSAVATADKKAPGSGFRRVRVGQNEVDYIAEDVTIRHFTSQPARPPTQVAERQIHFGRDVTVRYFGSKPSAASQAQPVSTPARTVIR